MKAPRQRTLCGTTQGHRAHVTYGEYACDPCLAARGRRNLANKIKSYRQDHMQLPVTYLGLLLQKIQLTDPTYLERVREELGDEVVDACIFRAENDV